MTDGERAQIAEHVAHAGHSMTLTARVLAHIADKTIVLTAALAPARFSESDAAINLGMAFATAQLAPPGIFITINGSVFPAAQVEKDRERGCFVAVPHS
jgi:L-asparaginase